MSTASQPLRHSPLHAEHEALGASFTDFAGYRMPVRYSGDLAEHHAVRRAAGLFDISHMAEFTAEGPGAAAYLDRTLSGRMSQLQPGRAKYSLLLNDAGGIVDDVIVYRLDEQRFLVIANAGNRAVVAEALEATAATTTAAAAGETGAVVIDRSDDFALIAIQGPAVEPILAALPGFDAGAEPLEALRYYHHRQASFEGTVLTLARTGYTGEDGFELLIETAAAPALWRALLEAGAAHGAVPAGLAARDTLRLEAGMPLYGHELGPETLPQQLGLARVVDLAKPEGFPGRTAIEAGPPAGARVLVGLAAQGRRAGRAGYPVLAALEGDPARPDEGWAAETVGEITSGVLSPTLGHPIAMAMVHPDHAAPGTALVIDVRGSAVAATVTELPFYRRAKASS